jgi:hypothetical protein
MTEVPEHLKKRAEEARAKAEAKKATQSEQEMADKLSAMPSSEEIIDLLEHLPMKLTTQLNLKIAEAEKAIEVTESQIRAHEQAIVDETAAHEQAIAEARERISHFETRIQEDNAKLLSLQGIDPTSLHIVAERYKDFL